MITCQKCGYNDHGTGDFSHACGPVEGGPPQHSEDSLDDFQDGQWWVVELDAAMKNGTPDQKRAVAVVRHLLRVVKATVSAQEPPCQKCLLMRKELRSIDASLDDPRVNLTITEAQAVAELKAEREGLWDDLSQAKRHIEGLRLNCENQFNATKDAQAHSHDLEVFIREHGLTPPPNRNCK